MTEKIRITKILNFPLKDGTAIELNGGFEFSESENIITMFLPQTDCPEKAMFDILKEPGVAFFPYAAEAKALYVVDDKGFQYTMFDFSYSYINRIDEVRITIVFSGLLKGCHINSLERIKIDKMEAITDYFKAVTLTLHHNNIHITSEPIYSKEGLSQEELEFLGEDSNGIYTKKIRLVLEGDNSFKTLERTMWRLSEFFLLYYENKFSYPVILLHSGANTYVLHYYRRLDKDGRRNGFLYTKEASTRVYCSFSYLENVSELFENFVDFREDSGIIFDMFRSTVYSRTFREDRPLRLSQTIEGLANYLGIVDTNKCDSFKHAILCSLLCNDDINKSLPHFQEKIEFCKKITAHRNKFSHVKSSGEFLKDDENERYAEILYSTIRVMIVKRLKGLL